MGLPENVFPGIMIALWPGCFLWECIIYWGGSLSSPNTSG